MKTKALAILLVVVVFGAVARAATLPQYAQEVSLAGKVDSDSELNIMLGAGWGYLVMDNFEGGIHGVADLRGNDTKDVRAGIFCEYNLEQNSVWLPYFGLELGLTMLDSEVQSATCPHLSAWGGIKYFVIRTMAIACQVQVWGATEPVYLGDKKLTQTDWALLFATRFYF
ncbi:MAG: hypothetical protein N2255_07875 [Kiritimatiellae bacterium]|nr:hypothetical protein [Kiritimatiellia bacterium]